MFSYPLLVLYMHQTGILLCRNFSRIEGNATAIVKETLFHKARLSYFRLSKKYLDLLKQKLSNMVVISYGTLRDFFEKHADSKDALNNWYRLVNQADWANFHEIKAMFNTVDAVGNDRFVFDIKGNHYRIVALIFFDIRTVYIRFVGTHKAYDKIDCATI